MRRAVVGIVLCAAFLAGGGCNKEDTIEGTAVEFVIRADKGVLDALTGMSIRATASNGAGAFCAHEPYDVTGQDLEGISGRSIVVYKGGTFAQSAALRVEGYGSGDAPVITMQALSIFPAEGVITVEVFLRESCLNVSCSEDGGNFTSQCADGACNSDATPAAGVFKEGGPIDEASPCVAG